MNYLLSETGQKLLFHPDVRKLPVRAAVYADKPEGYFDPIPDSDLSTDNLMFFGEFAGSTLSAGQKKVLGLNPGLR